MLWCWCSKGKAQKHWSDDGSEAHDEGWMNVLLLIDKRGVLLVWMLFLLASCDG